MLILPIRTPVIKKGDDLAAILSSCAEIQDGDIIVVSSKAVATAEGAAVDLNTLEPSPEALAWGEKSKQDPRFYEAVLRETARMNGRTIPGEWLFTELRPTGMKKGVILAAYAGMDQSNAGEHTAVGWPHDPVHSAIALRETLGGNVGVIISDSCCHIRRAGVTAYALAVAGFNPLQSYVGKADLFGRPLRYTVEATGDQLATAANMVMGSADQSIPAVIIRDHAVPFSGYAGWVDGIEPEEDIYRSFI
jgi:coenzyme F420-0:L-glutamate ligase/coenzyme F420-1:gamma-L-glutamate ligase